MIAIIVMTVISYLLRHHLNITGLETIGDRFEINASLPTPNGLAFNIETINQLLPAAFTIAILGAIESLLSATVADGVTGHKHNSNTELIAQGAANIVVPFFGGIPATGAIARTMTNINNGGKTPVAGLIHAVVLLLILLFLGPLTKHIPMACLAGVLVIVSYNMSEWRTFKSLMKNSRSDVAVLLTTFLLTVIFDLTIAIEIGLLLALVLFMKRMSEVTHITVAKDQLDLSNEGEIYHEIRRMYENHRRQTPHSYHPDAQSTVYGYDRAAQPGKPLPFIYERKNTGHPLRSKRTGSCNFGQIFLCPNHRRRKYLQ